MPCRGSSSLPRWCVALVGASLSIGLAWSGTASAGLGAGAAPTFPSAVTVGAIGVAGAIKVENDNTAPDTSSTVCNFGDGAPCPVGDPGITLIPSCGQLGTFSACTPAGADPGVFQISPTAVGQVGSACSGMVFDVTPIDAVFGQLRFTPQGGAHVVLPNPGSVCLIDFTFDVLKVATVDQNPAVAGKQTVQVVDNTQHDALITASGRGTSTGTTVAQATPTLATTASPGLVLAAGTLSDNVTVSGRVNPQPGATVDFRLYGPNDVTCSGAAVFESLGVPYPVAGGPVTSPPFTPTSAGEYRWVATYSGDANNTPASGSCNDAGESTVVGRVTPTITTAASANITIGSGQVVDTATVSGLVNPQPGATVDFRLYGPNDVDCSLSPAFESLGVAYPVAGGPVTSAAFTPVLAGTYRWVATYSGDANNNAVSGSCNNASESVTVVPVTLQLPPAAVAPQGPGPTLPATGSPTIGLLLLALGSTVVGFLLVASTAARGRFSIGRPRR